MPSALGHEGAGGGARAAPGRCFLSEADSVVFSGGWPAQPAPAEFITLL